MKCLVRFLSSKTTFFFLVALTILTLNLTPLVLQFRHSPGGRTFALIHNNAQDFFFYQALMNQGANGGWLTTDPYTSEPHRPSVIFAYFVWLGKVSKIIGLPYAITYHLLRIILGILFLFSIFYFLFSISIPYPRMAFFFFVFAAPFLHRIPGGRTIPFMNWWTGMDPIRRIAYLPHHMFGGLFLILSIVSIIKYFRQPEIKRLVILIFLSFLLAFVHTPSLFIILLMLPPAVILYLLLASAQQGKIFADRIRNLIPTKITSRSKDFVVKLGRIVHSETFLVCEQENFRMRAKSDESLKAHESRLNWIIALLVYWLIGLLFLVLMVSQTNRGFPWSQYLSWEKNLQFPLGKELAGAFGILLPFSLLGIVKAIRSKRFEYIFITSWFATPLILIPFAPSLNISNIRLIQAVPYLPLSILAVLGIKSLASAQLGKIITDRIRNLVSTKTTNKPKDAVIKHSKITHFGIFQICEQENFRLQARSALFHCFIVSLFLFFTIPTLSWSIKDQIKEYWPIFGNVYFDNRLYKAFTFINQNFPNKSVSLSTFYTGNYLPAFTHTVSFIGHFGYTYNIKSKEEKVGRFFANKMSTQEAKDFVLNNKIDLIFQGPEEKPIYNNYLYPSILTPVYDREEATIYTLK